MKCYFEFIICYEKTQFEQKLRQSEQNHARYAVLTQNLKPR